MAEETVRFCMQIALIVVLILLLICYFGKEYLAVAYSAGATQRFKSEFTSPSQGIRETDYNMEVVALQKRRNQEEMTPQMQTRGELNKARRVFYGSLN